MPILGPDFRKRSNVSRETRLKLIVIKAISQRLTEKFQRKFFCTKVLILEPLESFMLTPQGLVTFRYLFNITKPHPDAFARPAPFGGNSKALELAFTRRKL